MEFMTKLTTEHGELMSATKNNNDANNFRQPTSIVWTSAFGRREL